MLISDASYEQLLKSLEREQEKLKEARMYINELLEDNEALKRSIRLLTTDLRNKDVQS